MEIFIVLAEILTSFHHYGGFLLLEACLGSKEAVFGGCCRSVHVAYTAGGLRFFFVEAVCTVTVVAAKDHCLLWVAYDFLQTLQSVLFFPDKIFLI